MKVKIIDTNSAQTQRWIGETGELILNYPCISIKLDSTGKYKNTSYINTSKVQYIEVQTKNTKYLLEVIDNEQNI